MMNEIDLSRIDLNLLVLFEAVMEERHVGRTAQRMNLSPSAISHGLGRLRRLLNDPLFLRTPTGVVPTERAGQLTVPIAEALAKVRRVIATAEPFDPTTSTRRFVIGAPDSVAATLSRPLLAGLRHEAPGVALGFRQVLPIAGETSPARAWRGAFADLETRAADVAIIPTGEAEARFAGRDLYEEDFVLAVRAGHPAAPRVSLAAYAGAQHLVVSASGDPHGFVDDILAEHGLSRRVTLTVPNFMFAMALLGKSELVCAFPRRFAESYAERMGAVVVEPPLTLGRSRMTAFTLRSAESDEGLSWLLALLGRVAKG